MEFKIDSCDTEKFWQKPIVIVSETSGGERKRKEAFISMGVGRTVGREREEGKRRRRETGNKRKKRQKRSSLCSQGEVTRGGMRETVQQIPALINSTADL